MHFFINLILIYIMHDVDPIGWNEEGKRRNKGCANIAIFILVIIAMLLPIVLTYLKR